MTAFLTAVAFAVLIAMATYLIHRLNLQHADRIALRHYSAPLPDRRGRGRPQPAAGPGRYQPPTAGERERRDHRDGGRGRFPPRRRGTTAQR